MGDLQPAYQRLDWMQPYCRLKNSWNATLRSKAESKTRSFLWVYGKTVLEQEGMTSLDTFNKAVSTFCCTPGAVPLEAIAVAESYFSRIDAKASVHNGGSPVKVKVGPSFRPPLGRWATQALRKGVSGPGVGGSCCAWVCVFGWGGGWQPTFRTV